MNGSGFLEMVARQMTADLRAIAAATAPGASRLLTAKGVSEFLKSLQVLPQGTKSLIVDEHGHAKAGPPATASANAP